MESCVDKGDMDSGNVNNSGVDSSVDNGGADSSVDKGGVESGVDKGGVESGGSLSIGVALA